ncbi:MAG: hypothetical protein A2186_02230 [Candidatus Levybacteria bacterium RIFOXYA1_FULL_41_10]|nr:MAG: polymerase III subunit delta' protein [Candidatus Levybacteria bacterium GW2011_GWA1_39_32]KKR94999.1 MAG: polymerase III subunit delta' protein [Candidatus Levybacteria bacterium GW2011_GWA2_41_15]OGH21068.1 MAG: hypothetical protein A2695_01455 [Candidatus Levybacteria bacterium RIFCSPHIGHO2_01_FULL_40_83]OGH24543.1 MAG: hypothetical protein A3D82_02060 [Candidatus Levybacteria bacterium RIFCSPHIGHO2_02_FULL_40_29]OGH30340.1 MAG: hypothetical protein A3E70_03765 [Candidatus Levybacter
MQSIIIVSKDLEQAFQKALDITLEKKIGKFDIEILEFEKAMGIPDVRILKERIFLKPMGKEKAVILKLLNGITTEAQNALLKILEEPPLSCSIILVAESIEAFLPTVISRCRLLKIDPAKKDGKPASDLSILESGGVGEKFVVAQNLSKDKNIALDWLEDAITFVKKKAEDDLKKDAGVEVYESARRLRVLTQTYQTAKNTNANLRLTLENLFLSI